MSVRNYTYGAAAPILNVEQVAEQMRKAHEYGNKLVELKLDRRAKIDVALAAHSPELAETEAYLLRLETQLGELRKKIGG